MRYVGLPPLYCLGDQRPEKDAKVRQTPSLYLSLYKGRAPMLAGTLNWGLTRDKFDSLAASLKEVAWGASLRLRAWVPSEVDPYERIARCEQCSLDLVVCAQSEQERQVAKRLHGDALRDAMESAFFERHDRAARIVEELALSIGETALSVEEAQKLVDVALELMCAFRASVRPQASDGDAEVDWGVSREAFEKANVSKPDWARLKQGYDEMWQHPGDLYVSILSSAEKTSEAYPKGYDPRVWDLEKCAWRLLEHPALRSDTLERQLIDALVFRQNMVFAQIVLSEHSGAGLLHHYRLGFLTQSKADKTLGRKLLQIAGEAALLFGTWVLASAVSNGNMLATWAFFLAGTLTRWLFKTLYALKAVSEPLAQPQKLVLSMAQGYKLLEHAQFHRGVVRQELQRLTSLGAVYSPFVFELLERKRGS